MQLQLNHQAILSPPLLETKRLVLKPVCDDYRLMVFMSLSDKEVRHRMKMPCIDTPEKENEWWDRFADWRKTGKAVQWCGFLKDTGEYAGLFTFKEIDKSSDRGEVGYSILKQYWGRGLAGEGVKCLIDYGFLQIRFHTIFAMILPYNIPSQRIVRRLGFEQEAHFRDLHFYEGRYYDVLQFSLINPVHQGL